MNNKLNDKSCIVNALIIDGKENKNKIDIVNTFSNHFGTVGQRVSNEIPTTRHSFRDYLQNKKTNEKLLLNPINKTEISKA